MNSKPIGVFDSGIGGLTVTKEIMNILPNENIVYFGDTARVPYGNKSKETIQKFSIQISRFLETKNVKAIVIACNTASAFALEAVREKIDIPVIGVISAGSRGACACSKNKKVGIIGTEGTVLSKAYENKIKALREDFSIYAKACPLFVPIVEEGWAETEVSYMIAKEYLDSLKSTNIDTLVMGCTHYPLLNNVVQRVMGDNVTLINPAYETAKELSSILSERNIENKENSNPTYDFYVSDNSDKFLKVGETFLNRSINNIKEIDIERY